MRSRRWSALKRSTVQAVQAAQAVQVVQAIQAIQAVSGRWWSAVQAVAL